jgi:hypothetical protein
VYEVYDCLSESVVKTGTRIECDAFIKSKGILSGYILRENVDIETKKTVIEPLKIAEKQPQTGFLF